MRLRRSCRLGNDHRRAFLATALVGLAGFAAFTGLLLGVPAPASAQGTYQIQRNPTACDAIGSNMTDCQGAFSSDNIYASNSGWYYSDWPYRKKITIDSAKVTANLSDFPVLISITDPDLRDHAQNDGDDILFTHADGITKLSHEIERFNGTTGELVAWVNVTELSSTVDTEIYMHYGHGTVGSQEDTTGVWDSGYAGVYHLAEIPDGTVDDVGDSTQYANHGTSSGMTPNAQAAGRIGGGLNFEIADIVTVSSNASLEFEQAGSFELWFNSDVDLNFVPGGGTPRYRVLVERGGSNALYYDSARGRFQMHIFQMGGYSTYHTRLDGSGPQSVQAGEWHHLAFVFNRTHGWAYFDGIPRGDGESDFSGQDFRTGGSMILGAESWEWEGSLDEFRVSDLALESVRSAGWIASGFSNQNDSSAFYSVGAEDRVVSDTAWNNFGFDLNETDTINLVEIGVEWFRESAAPTLAVTISWDGGTSWAPNEIATNKSTDDSTLQFLDFTSAVSWTPSRLNDSNLRARAGTNASGAHLDHIVVRVTFATIPPSEPGSDIAPKVVTLEATNVTYDTAVLRGSLVNFGSATGVQVTFEWGLSPVLGEETPTITLQKPTDFQASLEALNPGTSYYYRAKAVGNGTALGETLTVQTAPQAPAQDSLSQLLLVLPIAIVALLTATFFTRKLVGTSRRQGVAGSSPPGTAETAVSAGGLFAKVAPLASPTRGRGKFLAGGQETPHAPSTSTGVICPHCGSLLEAEAVNCFGCGRSVAEVADQTKLESERETFEQEVQDPHAFIAIGAHSTGAGGGQKAIEMLDGLDAAASEASREVAAEKGSDGPGSCLYCGTTVDPATGNCSECVRSRLATSDALEEEVTRALATLELDENDTAALFTLGTYLLLDGKDQQALDTLNRLTLLDPDYPGLWRAKALIFEKLGNKGAAEWALIQARRRSTHPSADAE